MLEKNHDVNYRFQIPTQYFRFTAQASSTATSPTDLADASGATRTGDSQVLITCMNCQLFRLVWFSILSFHIRIFETVH